MKKIASAIFATTLAFSAARGQGLLSIGANHDFDDKMPFSATLASSVGWDSNMNTSKDNAHSSGYWQNGISIFYPMGDRRNHLTLGGHYSNIWYFDPAPGEKDVYNNGRFSMDFVRTVSPRFTISDSAYVAYETEPDYLIGASANRRVNQYLYGYNNLSGTYVWTRRWSTVTSYTLTGIRYDENFQEGDNYLTHILGQQFRYSLTRQTTLTLDYRAQFIQHETNSGADSVTHYILGGIDEAFSPHLTGSLRVGAQIRDYDFTGTRTEPYLESALTYRAGKDTTFRWFAYLGMDDSEMSGFFSSYSFRTGLTWDQKITDRLNSSISLNYVHENFSQSSQLSSFADDTFAGSLGLDYRLWRNISANASYWYTMNTSDNPLREYDRHRVSLGLNATF